MKSKLFFLILLISLNVPLVYSAPDEGYGEANENLGQFTDTFLNETYVSVLENVIVNTTLECVELNYTLSASKRYENFSEYTQVEPDDRVDVQSDTHVAHQAIRNEDSYLYYDYGTDYFDDFTHQFIWESDFGDLTGFGFIWMVSDTIDDGNGIAVSNGNYLSLYTYIDGSGRRLGLLEVAGGAYFQDLWQPGPLINTLYYVNVSKYGTNLTASVYDDVNMTSVVKVLSLTLQTDHKLEYIMAVNSYNTGSGAIINNDVYNLWIGRMLGGFYKEGYFTTEDYLNYTQGKSLALLTIADIPVSTVITVQFSTDNMTWVDNHGAPGSSTVRAGFSALDLRDLNYADLFMRYNLTGPGGSSSPRVNQSRVVTTNGTAGGAPGPGVTVIESDAPWIAIAIILSIIGLLLGTRIKR